MNFVQILQSLFAFEFTRPLIFPASNVQLDANVCRKFDRIKVFGGFARNGLPARKCDNITIMVPFRELVLYRNFGCKRELGIITAEIVTLPVE